ncbi:MAG: mechanosensitive ion channel family protein [Candidatus Peribacteraceae bacterium]|nr:mechanosensitive ion channel family protein [Candidatus Peribacteraceae bacterium]
MEPFKPFVESAPYSFIESLLQSVGLKDMETLSNVYLGNSALNWIIAVILFFVTVIILFVFLRIVVGHLKKISSKTKWKIDDILVSYIDGLGALIYFSVSLFVSTQHLSLPDPVLLTIKAIFYFALVYEVIKLIEDLSIKLLMLKLGKNGVEAKSLSSALGIIIRLVLWSVGFLLILSNLGVNVTSLIASLGIGGLAVSLALQPVFQDMFSSFSILLDKPFEEGDYIVYGEYAGNVKHIGLKTTRITALQGEEVVISNAELTGGKVQNFKKMKKRRIVFGFGVSYDTTSKQLKKILKIIKDIIKGDDLLKLDRVHFKEFGDSNLNFEVVYFIASSKYVDYMNSQQNMNFKIIEEFEKEGIEIAYPTTTVHLVKDKGE